MVEVVFVVGEEQSDDNIDDDKGKRRGKPLKKGQERVVVRPVTVGISSDTHYEIVDGLEEGEKIVTGSYKAISRDLKHMSVVEEEGGSGSKNLIKGMNK